MSGRYEWANVSRLSTYKCIQRRVFIERNEDYVPDAVLPTLEEDEVPRLNWRRHVCDAQVVAGHVMDANRNAEHILNRAVAGCASLERS